jgi:outer membrane protein OmpA-like peptidoglycan-associated protein
VAKVPNSYLVFFNWGSSELSDDAMDVIAQTVENARRGKVTWIMAVGHADTSGAPAYNDGLSRRRAESVGSALVARGIPHNQITIGSKGEEEPFVPTGDGIREAQNRRVLVSFPGR